MTKQHGGRFEWKESDFLHKKNNLSKVPEVINAKSERSRVDSAPMLIQRNNEKSHDRTKVGIEYDFTFKFNDRSF